MGPTPSSLQKDRVGQFDLLDIILYHILEKISDVLSTDDSDTSKTHSYLI